MTLDDQAGRRRGKRELAEKILRTRSRKPKLLNQNNNLTAEVTGASILSRLSQKITERQRLTAPTLSCWRRARVETLTGAWEHSSTQRNSPVNASISSAPFAAGTQNAELAELRQPTPQP